MTQPTLKGSFPLLTLLGKPVLEVSWSMDFSSFDIALVENLNSDAPLWHIKLTPANSSASYSANQGIVRENLEVSVDFSLGELRVKGSVGHRLPPLTDWSDSSIEQHVFWNPALGSVGGRSVSYAPVVDDSRFGKSKSIVPTVNRIVIDEKPRIGTDVGIKVKKLFFASEPDFLFNVCFAVGDFVTGVIGLYGNPTSIWFNVFMGYYEIDVPVSRGRPFGYKTDATTNRQLELLDIVRIAKADWNYFSNYMYGVPESAIAAHNNVTADVPCQQTAERIGSNEWDLLTVGKVDVVSAYAPGGSGSLTDNSVLSPLWRQTFGLPAGPVDGGLQPFAKTEMRARMYVSFRREDGRYRTRIFGGTVSNLHDDEEFLGAQQAACRTVIETHFADLGFQ